MIWEIQQFCLETCIAVYRSSHWRTTKCQPGISGQFSKFHPSVSGTLHLCSVCPRISHTVMRTYQTDINCISDLLLMLNSQLCLSRSYLKQFYRVPSSGGWGVSWLGLIPCTVFFKLFKRCEPLNFSDLCSHWLTCSTTACHSRVADNLSCKCPITAVTFIPYILVQSNDIKLTAYTSM